jgi:hypothetical protein
MWATTFNRKAASDAGWFGYPFLGVADIYSMFRCKRFPFVTFTGLGT